MATKNHLLQDLTGFEI